MNKVAQLIKIARDMVAGADQDPSHHHRMFNHYRTKYEGAKRKNESDALKGNWHATRYRMATGKLILVHNDVAKATKTDHSVYSS